MSATDTAKEFVRIASTAGLSKDVIDLLEKKSALLAEQVSALERENSQLRGEIVQLRQQLQRLQPVAGAFHEFAGVLWKRAGRGFEMTPYCPECANHPIMYGQPPGFPTPVMWQCSKCGFRANYASGPVA